MCESAPLHRLQSAVFLLGTAPVLGNLCQLPHERCAL